MATTGEADLFLRVILLGLAALLTILSLVAALRLSEKRLLMVGAAFAAFAVKGLLLVLAIFLAALNFIDQAFEVTLLDMAILGLLYVASITGPRGTKGHEG
jgi:hypothetical protein